MSRTRSKKGNGNSSKDELPERRNGNGPSKRGRRYALYAALAILACAIVVVAAVANNSYQRLSIKDGDILQYSISGSQNGQNVTGSLIIEVTSVTTHSFTVNYAVTLNGSKNSYSHTFDDAGTDWKANIGNVIGELYGGYVTPTVGNASDGITKDGNRNMTMYSVDTTYNTATQQGVRVLVVYWLDSSTGCPYTLTMTYQNMDFNSFYLVYTNISEYTAS